MVKNIIIECLRLLDDTTLKQKIENVINKSDLKEELIDFTDMEKETIELLVGLVKNVINSVTKSYLKNYTIERVKSDDNGNIMYTSLSKPIVSIKDVSDSLNNLIVYRTFYDHIKVPFKNFEYYVCYNFETTDFNSLFDEVCLPLGLSNYCVALGTVSAYHQIKLLFTEAELYESKFKNELSQIKTHNSSRSFFVWRN